MIESSFSFFISFPFKLLFYACYKCWVDWWTGDLHISFFDIMINTQIAGLLMDN